MIRLRYISTGMTELLAAPSSPVAKDLAKRARRVESRAKLRATGPPGPNVQTGRLRASIAAGSVKFATEGLFVDIGSNVEYARIIELGGRTPPHPIRPRFKKALYWEGIRNDRPVAFVKHPGSRFHPRPYLAPALVAAL